jgi:hypothetical protein
MGSCDIIVSDGRFDARSSWRRKGLGVSTVFWNW